MARTRELSHLVAQIALVFFIGFLGALIAAWMLPWLKLIPVHSPTFINALRVLGFGSLAFGTVVVFLSQKFRKHLYTANTNKLCFNFYVGPYKYLRHPTYLGLLILMFGLSCILNSLPVFVVACVTLVVAHLTLIRAEDKLLAGECGEVYQNYQKKVRI